MRLASSVHAVPEQSLSAIPPVAARVIAFVAILLGGEFNAALRARRQAGALEG